MINEFKYGQTWKIWPFQLSLSLYSTFTVWYLENKIDSSSDVEFTLMLYEEGVSQSLAT